MKNIFFLMLVIWFSPYSLKSQSKNFIGLEAAITSSNTYYYPGSIQEIEVFSNSNFLVEHKPNWNAAINYHRKINKNLFIKTGLEVASHGYALEEHYLMFMSRNNPFPVVTKFNILSILIPVALRFEVFESKFKPFIEAGISPGIYALNNSVNIVPGIPNTTRYKEVLFDTFIISPNFAVGGSYELNESKVVYMQVHHQSIFTDRLIEEPLFDIDYSIGLRAGIRWVI